MREHIYRVWDTKYKMMFYDGSSNIYFSLKDSIDGGIIISSKILKFTDWIGLEDKNEKMIYDGDIVSIGNEEKFEVQYSNNRASFVMIGLITGKLRLFENIECMKSNDFHIDVNKLEVIGNIYENPELLETSE